MIVEDDEENNQTSAESRARRRHKKAIPKGPGTIILKPKSDGSGGSPSSCSRFGQERNLNQAKLPFPPCGEGCGALANGVSLGGAGWGGCVAARALGESR